jgi:hypothetical protein
MMKRKTVSVLVALFLVVMSASLHAEKKGRDVFILKKNGETLRGELIAVKEDRDSLENSKILIQEHQTEGDAFVLLGECSVIKVDRKSKLLLHLGIGTGVGLLLAAMVPREQNPNIDGRNMADYAWPFFGGGGFLLGMVTGIYSGSDKKFFTEKLSRVGLDVTLEKLKGYARIKDYN